jgi:hypothetical protein
MTFPIVIVLKYEILSYFFILTSTKILANQTMKKLLNAMFSQKYVYQSMIGIYVIVKKASKGIMQLINVKV